MDGEGLVTTGLGGLWRWWRIGPQGRRELKRIYKQAIRDAVQDSATRRSAISVVNDPVFFDRVAFPDDINQQTEKSEFGKRLRALCPNAKRSDIEEVVEQVFIHILRRLHHAQYQQWKEKSAEWKANNPTAAGTHEPVLKSQERQLRVERLLGDFEPQSPQDVTRTFLDGKKLSNTQFYGRQWLYDDVVNWLQTGTEVVYWLQADAGFGKSSFCSRLSVGWDDQRLVTVAAIVYCGPSVGPYEVLRDICRQLRATCPEYAQEFDTAWNRVEWNKVSVPPALDQAGKEQEQFADELIGSLLIGPLSKRLNSQQLSSRPLNKLIVIDALDEVLQSTGGEQYNPLETLLRRLLRAKLPNFRVLLTSRPARMYPKLQDFLGAEHPRDGKPDTAGMDRDARLFIEHELANDWHTEAVVKQLLEKSKSSMLYLHFLADDIRNRHLTAADVAQLPNSLAKYYLYKLNQYFSDDDAKYEKLVRPCLEAVAAGERTDVSAADLEACLGKVAVDEMRTSMRAMMLERVSLMVEQAKMIDGKQSTIFVPFHLSFMDWLLGRSFDDGSTDQTAADHAHGKQHRFRIFVEEGDRILAKWAWCEYTRRKPDRSFEPVPHDYWIRQGVYHLLRTFDHLDKGRLKPAVKKTNHLLQAVEYLLRTFAPWHSGLWKLLPTPPVEKYSHVVQAVEFMGWLNRFPAAADIVAGSLPLLSATLKQTEKDLDSPGTACVTLQALEDVNQQTLFDLVKDTCATEITEPVIWWIGCTQKQGWRELVPQMLALDEYVMRFAAACGQAARYERLTADGEEADAVAEIDKLLESTNMNEQEMGCYTVGEVGKAQIPQRITPQIRKWLQKVSDTDRYFCQSVLGDLLIDLSLKGKHQQVANLDAIGVITAFWNPLWEYTRLDVISVLALRAHQQPLRRNIDQFQTEVIRELSAIRNREQRIEKFKKAAGDLAADLAVIVHKTELDDADNDKIIEWLTRDGLDSDLRVRTAVEFLQLMFTHPSWRICEKGSAILPLLGAQSEWRDTCIQILDRLLNSLDRSENGPDPANWRVILGTSEACYLTRHFDPGREFVPGKRIPRLEHCWREFHNHWNCHVRALLAEGFFFIVGEQDVGRNGWESGRATEYLLKFTQEIKHWLLDRDVWVLEHVYQVFQIIDERQVDDLTLQTWAKEHLAHVQAHPECLLARVTHNAGKSWVKMDRAEFLDRLQALRKRQPFPA